MTSLRMQKLGFYQVAKAIAVRVHEARIGDVELRDQATRAAKSTFLRLAEGLPNEGAGMRRKYFVEGTWTQTAKTFSASYFSGISCGPASAGHVAMSKS